jgi:hypothetical protein
MPRASNPFALGAPSEQPGPMAEMAIRWPVRMEVPLAGLGRDASGCLTEEGLGTVFAAVRAAYLEGCASLAGVEVAVEDLRLTLGAVPVEGDHVVAAAAVNEVYPTLFTMVARVRPAAGPGLAGSASCDLRPAGGVTRAVQTELIARAHAASHFA